MIDASKVFILIVIAAFGYGAVITTCPTNNFVPTNSYILQGNCTVQGNVGFSGSGFLSLTSGTLRVVNGSLAMIGNAFILVSKGNIYVDGPVQLSNNASLSVSRGILSVTGNLGLLNDALVTISGGQFILPQTNTDQYSIFMTNNAVLRLVSTSMATNFGAGYSFTASIDCYEFSQFIVQNSYINTNNGNWLLANLFGNSILNITNSNQLPTEIYPSQSSTVDMSDSDVATIWLSPTSGSASTIVVPSTNSNGRFSFDYGNTPGNDYSVSVTNGDCRIGINSYPNTKIFIDGTGTSANSVDLVFGYYVMNSTEPVTISNLQVSTVVTANYTDSGRLLSLNNVYINPFSWQIYVSDSNGFETLITNSIVNELGVFSGGTASATDCVFQLAVLEVGGTGAQAVVTNSQIWSQTIVATQGGVLNINGGSIHGNFVNSNGVGSEIVFSSNTIDLRNGNATISNCNPNSAGYPPNIQGVPLCSPYMPLHECAAVSSSSGGTVNIVPSCPYYNATQSPTMAPTNTVDDDSINYSAHGIKVISIIIGGSIAILVAGCTLAGIFRGNSLVNRPSTIIINPDDLQKRHFDGSTVFNPATSSMHGGQIL